MALPSCVRLWPRGMPVVNVDALTYVACLAYVDSVASSPLYRNISPIGWAYFLLTGEHRWPKRWPNPLSLGFRPVRHQTPVDAKPRRTQTADVIEKDPLSAQHTIGCHSSAQSFGSEMRNTSLDRQIRHPGQKRVLPPGIVVT